LLKQQDHYQDVRMRRYRSQARQRSTRAKLALLLDRPDDPPSDLAKPKLAENDQPLPEYEHLVQTALARNPRVLSLKADLEAARLQIKAERAGNRPVLSGSVAATASNRDLSSRNPLEAELRLDIPLYEGNRVDAGIAKAQAKLHRLGAELRQQEYDLRQSLLEVWLDIQALLAQREQVRTFTDYRDLNFDRAQALYEMEFKTDFGDALVGQSESALLAARTEFQLALDWARLSALSGEPYSPYLQMPETDPGDNTDAKSDR
jgi:outer membrane protein TolC